MGIAETDKNALIGAVDLKPQKARQRAFLKRRAAQISNSHLQNNWSMCTDMQRQWNRRRMRRLFSSEKPKTTEGPGTCQSDLKQGIAAFFRYTLIPMMLVFGLSCGITLYQNDSTMSKFMQRYMSHYYAIVHNKLDYCDRTIQLRNIFDSIHENVLNQEAPLEQLEQALGNQSAFQSIALVGSSGVGKSLTMRLLLELYPWPENVQSIAWNDFDLTDDEARFQTVKRALRNLAHCGCNLLIIDNMPACDVDFVSAINALVRALGDVADDISDLDRKQLTIIYVFNLNAMLPNDQYGEQLDMVKQLPQTTVITYRSFDRFDLERCVRHEAKVVDLHLADQYIEEMVNTVNVKTSGCKSVRTKVLIYGRPQ